MSQAILERHLKQGTPRPLYLFYGEEEFLMERALARLEAGLAARLGEAPAKVVASAQDTGLEEFLAQARHATLFGPGQLLILRRADAYPERVVQAALPPYLEHPAPRAWVVLLAPALKTREVERHPVWSRLKKSEAALGFRRLREEELHQWLAREAQDRGKHLSLATAQALVAVVGDNLAELTQELEKLVLYAGAEPRLTPAMVQQLASHSRTFTIFALVDALGEADPRLRLSALDQLLELGEPAAKILTMLARQVRLLLIARELGEAPPPELAARLGVPPSIAQNIRRQAARFSPAALRRHLWLLHQADRHLKTSSGNPRLWLEWALVQMGPG
ncbi:MAG: DNA polymerase III subunit delta [Syntrophobacterales bacterium]|nr:DNA polymerase III subunit delta [Syntrophobacterales bacterium]